MQLDHVPSLFATKTPDVVFLDDAPVVLEGGGTVGQVTGL